MTNTESEQKLDPKLLRQIRQLHRRSRRLAALDLDSVQPPPIVNRRTGETTTFGHRRAFDGAWVLEMLGASGCTKEEVNAAIFVLEALIDEHVASVREDATWERNEAQENREKHQLEAVHEHWDMVAGFVEEIDNGEA